MAGCGRYTNPACSYKYSVRLIRKYMYLSEKSKSDAWLLFTPATPRERTASTCSAHLECVFAFLN